MGFSLSPQAPTGSREGEVAVNFVADDPDYAGTMTMTWAVTATEDGTRVDFRADDVPVGISAEDHAAGLASSLANLAAYVER
ncbi:SRPBCC domain-containing protein [Plantactinospora sp. B5E13]|uniref:SRPBCC domain-containing protein n=1 Tax=Plantactinospora sp. B5E13 TaxID=3153758 RepID=UPI00325C5B0A